MERRARTAAISALLCLCFLITPLLAEAQSDHLKCYKMKDPLRLSGTVNIDSEQLGYEENCKIRRARVFCVPAEKDVVEAFDAGDPIGLAKINGQELVDDRICYRIKCPQPFPPDQQLSDQFGTNRVLQNLRPYMVCTPASMVACSDTFPPMCNGPCDAGQTCRDVDGTCQCVDVCSTGIAPECAGACPEGQRCETVFLGPFPLDCRCTPTEPACSDTEPISWCGGSCPTGLLCLPSPSVDECRCTSPVVMPCPSVGPPSCSEGFCDGGQSCVQQGDDCGCQ